MHSIAVPHFEDLMLTTGRSADELERELRILLAIKLFELKRVAIGRAAEIAGIGKIAFADELGRAGVPMINFSEDQLEHEFRDI